VQRVTSGAGDHIYINKIVTEKVREHFSLAKAREILLSLFVQVRFKLAGFGVFCSQDRTRRIFQFAHL
jgi:hypothetical protein